MQIVNIRAVAIATAQHDMIAKHYSVAPKD